MIFKAFLSLFLLTIIPAHVGAEAKNVGQDWSSYKVGKARDILHQIQQSTMQSVISKYNVRCIGEGAGMCGGPIRLISLCFQVVGPLTRNEVRRLLFFIANEMILQAKRIPNLDTYLAAPPFSLKNVQVVLFQVDEWNAGLRHPIFNACSFDGDSLSYDATDPVGGPWAPYKEEITETYEEALEALRKEYEQYQTAQMLDMSPEG